MKTDQNTPKLSGFIFNDKLGLYVNQMLLSRGRLSEDSTKRPNFSLNINPLSFGVF